MPSFASRFSEVLWRIPSNYLFVAHRQMIQRALHILKELIKCLSGFVLERTPVSITSHSAGPTTLKGTADVLGHCFSTWILSSPQSTEMAMVLQTVLHICTRILAGYMNGSVYFIRHTLSEKKTGGLNSEWFIFSSYLHISLKHTAKGTVPYGQAEVT